MATRPKALVKRVMEAGEAQVDRLVAQLLSNERFIAAVQGVVSRSLAAKGTIDKSLQAALSSMNLPTSSDVEELNKRLDRLDRVLAEVDGKLTKLEKESEAKAGAKGSGSKASAGGAKKPSGGGTAEGRAKKAAAAKAGSAQTKKAATGRASGAQTKKAAAGSSDG